MRKLAYLLTCSLMAMLIALPFAGAQETATVSMEDNFFDQANITVEQGTTVTWVQNGENAHTTTSYDGLWDSGIIAGGSDATFSHTFDEPGTFDYFCQPHESLGMVGTVTVTASSGDGTGDAADNGAIDNGTSTTTGEQYTDDVADDGVPELPATGGPALLPIASLVMIGLGGLLLRRLLS